MIQQNINQIISLSSLLMSQNPIIQQMGKESAAKRQLGFEREKHEQKTAALRKATGEGGVYDIQKTRDKLKDPDTPTQQKEAAQDVLDAISNVREAHAAAGEELERREYELNPTEAGAVNAIERELGEVVEASDAARVKRAEEKEKREEIKRQEENTRAEKARKAREKAAADLEARREEIRSTLLQGTPQGPIRKGGK